MMAIQAEYFLAVLFLTVHSTTGTASQCSYAIKFRDINSTVFAPEINTNFSIDFRFEPTPAECDLAENIRVTVRKRTGVFEVPLCYVSRVNGTCQVPLFDDICECLPERGWYRLSKHIEETDYALWVWRTNKDDVQGVTVNITRPTSSKDTTSFRNAITEEHEGTQSIISETTEVPQSSDLVTDTVPQVTTEVSELLQRTPTKTEETSESKDGADFWSGTGAAVLGSVAIIGVTATVIAVIVVRAIKLKGWTHHDHISHPQPKAAADEDNDIQCQCDERPPTQEYNIYMEIPDDIPLSAGASVCSPSAPEPDPPDGYLIPVSACAEREGASVSSPQAPKAAPNDGYLTPLPPRAARQGADAGGLISPARVSSEDACDSYERPVNPDYTTPNPVYQPLRHLYETVRQWRHSKRDSRPLDQEK